MPPNYGTRQRVNAQHERVAQGAPNGSITRDVGMSKNVTTLVTFSNGRVLGESVLYGTFAAFAVNDPIEITGAPINLGFFTVIGLDGADHNYLILDPPPENGGPFTATIRTP